MALYRGKKSNLKQSTHVSEDMKKNRVARTKIEVL